MEFFKQVAVFVFMSISIFAQNYSLIWSEEFSSPVLDENIWTRQIGGDGWGNNELQYYTDRDTNAYIHEGQLVIQALKENFGSSIYTSARLKTENKFSFKYGKIEARIKLPFGQGIWPAFWMLGINHAFVGWPSSGEIDIMEMVGGPANENVVHGTVHWNDNGHAEYGGEYRLSNGIFADDYHIFSIEWTPKFIKWFVDGIQYHVIDITPGGLSEFHQEFFIILNIAVGGNWPGYPDATSTYPQKMEVDYVRVYQDESYFPEIILTEPNENSNFEEFDDITLSTSIDFDGEIRKVEFYQGDLQIGETVVEPYEMIWRNISAGNYQVSAIASTSEGYKQQSPIVNITVGEGSISSPYSGSLIQIPGIIEAENYDLGGPGIGYSDLSAPNLGGAYRKTEGVDIELCFDDNGGYNIGWIEKDEWLEYSVEVMESGEYEINVRVASANSTGKFRIQIDGIDVTDIIGVPNTGGFQKWTSVSSNIELTEGKHNLKIIAITGDFNLNKFEIYKPGTQQEVILLEPIGGEKYEVGSVQEIRWDYLKINEVSLGLSTDGGNNWSSIAKNIKSHFKSYRWLVPDSKSDNCLILIIDSKITSINDVTDQPFSIDFVSSVNKLINNKSFHLSQNYPNPFNPSTIIQFTVPVTNSDINKYQHVKLAVYDALGKNVVTLVDEQKGPGNYQVSFDGKNLSNGTYFYKITIGDISEYKKMLLLK